MAGRTEMLAAGNLGDWHAAFGEILCSSVLKTPMSSRIAGDVVKAQRCMPPDFLDVGACYRNLTVSVSGLIRQKTNS